MPTAVKKPKAKSVREIKDALELIQWKIRTQKCQCGSCQIAVLVYQAFDDVLLWALGEKTKDFHRILRTIKKLNARETKHHIAVVE
jgi:hypothetical protein